MTGISIITTASGDLAPLQRLLTQFLGTNSYVPVEWIIINNAPSRGAAAFTELATRQFIRHINFEKSLPLPECRNLAARRARYPTLLFLANTVSYTADVLPRIAETLSGPDIGAVSIGLEALNTHGATTDKHPLPQTGITFQWDRRRLMFRPVPIYDQPEPENSRGASAQGPQARAVPALSGAFLACRKTDFETLGGFPPKYVTGLEAVEFCVQLAARLNKRCLCITDFTLPRERAALDPAADERTRAKQETEDETRFRCRMGKTVAALIHGSVTSAPRWRTALSTHAETLRVLFVLPSQLDSNCGYHAQGIANKLHQRGIECAFAVPDTPPTTWDSTGRFPVQSFADLETCGPGFVDGRSPTIVHAWTPRELIRRFCQPFLREHPARLVIHLEDNEQYLTEKATRKTWSTLLRMPLTEQDTLVLPNCYHPKYGPAWLETAQGLTFVTDTLKRFNTPGHSSLVVPPVVDERLFHPRPLNRALRAKLDIPEDHVVLVYAGNAHTSNVDEVFELYQAVELLNAQGCPTTLLRTGADPKWIAALDWPQEHVIKLGWAAREELPDILAAADFFVQPGQPGPFNNERLPSKLPEFFAVGRPVILPRTNIGLFAQHERDAYVLDNANAQGIVEAILRLKADPALAGRLADGAKKFYRAHWGDADIGQKLGEFYASLTVDSARQQVSPPSIS